MKELVVSIIILLLCLGNSVARTGNEAGIYFNIKAARSINSNDSVFQNWGGLKIEVADELVTADSAMVYFKSDRIVVDAYHNVKLVNNPKVIETVKSERTVNGQKLQRSSRAVTAEHMRLEYKK